MFRCRSEIGGVHECFQGERYTGAASDHTSTPRSFHDELPKRRSNRVFQNKYCYPRPFRAWTIDDSIVRWMYTR